MPFVLAVMGLIAGILFLLSARRAFSLYGAMAVMTVTSLISVAKYRAKGFDLHVYDFVFTGTDGDALGLLAGEFGDLVVPILAFLALTAGFLALVWRWERPVRLGALFRSATPVCCAAMLPLFYPTDPDEPRYFYYLAGFNASSFYISFLDLPSSAAPSPIAARMDALPPVAAFPEPGPCAPGADRPDIFIVLSESATDLSIFPQLAGNNWVGATFGPDHPERRPLRVETYAGGTWVSNLSLMTGLSSTDFGWRAPYLTNALQDRVHESLPLALARCGYRTVAQLPMKYGFVNEGPFMRSIGFETVRDYDAIGATDYVHRDDFYYDAAERFIAEHRADDGRPLFMQIQTMFPHSPYDKRAEPHFDMPAGKWTDNARLDEYVKRVLVAQEDFHAFLERRAAEAPERSSVVLEFGDHQSAVTRQFSDEMTGGNSLADLQSVAYRTYYSLHAYGHELAVGDFVREPLDIAYLGVSFLQAAGIPLSPAFADLAALRDHCGGRFQDCADREAVDRHIKRRIETGLLSLP
jgi:hypothetical protein